jgi:hypothetical protein
MEKLFSEALRRNQPSNIQPSALNTTDLDFGDAPNPSPRNRGVGAKSGSYFL